MTSQFTTPRPEPKRNRWGQYLLPDPETGQEKAWTRVTTFAKTISDMYGLARWQERMVAKGIATRSDLYALAAATPIDDKTKLNKICDDAKEAAKASSGANLGTALHAFTEQVDHGEDVDVPEPWNADIAAYQTKLTQARVTVRRDWVERVVIIPTYGVAGTLDRILQLPDGRLVIGDVKTGKDLAYSWAEIAVQLALYANATHAVDLATGRTEPMPAVDVNTALVIHLPAGKAVCELHTVDIAAGWEAAYICMIVRDWRSRKDLAAPYQPPADPPPMDDPLLGRITSAATEAELNTVWDETWSQWADQHADAARTRKATLRASAGPAGGQQEKEAATA